MTGPKTTRPILLTMFGGVTINENDVKSKHVEKKDGKTRYIINFNDGTKVEYPEQAKQNKSTIFIEKHEKNYDRETPVYTNMAYAQITGSKGFDIFNLRGCNSCYLDVSNDNYTDIVNLTDSANRESKNNKVKMDKCDDTYLKDFNRASGNGTLDERAYY